MYLTFSWMPSIVVLVSPVSPRLLFVRFDREGAALFRALYELGRPIQYAHVPEPLELWSVQTAYAAITDHRDLFSGRTYLELEIQADRFPNLHHNT